MKGQHHINSAAAFRIFIYCRTVSVPVLVSASKAVLPVFHQYPADMLTLTFLLAALSGAVTNCNVTSKEPTVTVEVPGTPFQALPSADGCWIFVSIPGGQSGGQSVIALYKRSNGALSLVR